MSVSGRSPALEGARAEILAIAGEFSATAPALVEAALHRRLEALIESRPEWRDRLGSHGHQALRAAASRAVHAGSEEVRRRLSADELWLSPLTAPGVVAEPETGWDGQLPEWISGLLHRLSRRRARSVELGDLDDPGNRIWVALTAAAKPLDPVLGEFGLEPASVPDMGGGHYGITPRTAEQLDPSGTLVRLWRRYRVAHARYLALERDGR